MITPSRRVLLAMLVGTGSCAATLQATQAAHPAEASDQRVRMVPYAARQVTEIAVQRGTATRIVLGDDEKIQPDGASTGFPSDCSKLELEWCVRAQPGGNQVLVKPQQGATHNNLELKTNLRDYSIAFEVLADRVAPGVGKARAPATVPAHRVIFVYPEASVATHPAPAHPTEVAPSAPTPKDLLSAARPSPRNWQYSMQAMAGSDDIVPRIVFDDGRFTYFQFPANREMPTIFYVSAAGEEGRVNFHIDEQAPDTVVVERMSRRFMLRLGKAAIGIWNDAFDAYGSPPIDGTTVDGVARTMRKE